MSPKSTIKVHLIFVTKYRKKVLTDAILSEIYHLIDDKMKKMRCEVIAMRGNDMNHIHIMAQIQPTQSISLIVQILKSITTYHVWREHPELRKYYWGANYLWSRGYFCCTTGDASSETIEKYINNQGD